MDIAELGMRFHTEGAEAANRQLDQVEQKSAKAEAATKKLSATQLAMGQSATAAYSPMREMAAAVAQVEAEQRAAALSGNTLARGITNVASTMGVATTGGGRMSGMLAELVIGGGAAGAVFGGVAIAVTGLGLAWLRGEASALGYERAISGVGRTAGLTADRLQDLAIQGAAQGEISVRSAQTQATAYLATGRIGAESISTLLRIGKDFSSFMGVDAARGAEMLADAMANPDRAAKEMTKTFGLLTQEQIKQVDAAIKAGDQAKAQAVILGELDRAVDGHAKNTAKITTAWDAVGRSISNAITRLGEFLYIDEDEKISKLGRQLAPYDADRMKGNAWYDRTVAERDALVQERAAREARQRDTAERARDNQAALLAAEANAASNKKAASAAAAAAKAAAEAARRFGLETDAILANAAATIKLAEAYDTGGTAALRAEAHRRAVTEATKKERDATAELARENAILALAVAEAVATGTRTTADLGVRTAAQVKANEAVRSGNMSAADALQRMNDDLALRPLALAAAVAQKTVTDAGTLATRNQIAASEAAMAALMGQVTAQTDANQAQQDWNVLAAQSIQADQIEMLKLEAALIGASNRERAVALAQLAAEQKYKAFKTTAAGGGPDYLALVNQAKEIAALTDDNRSATDNWNNSLSYTLDLLSQMNAHSQDLASGLTSAFGEVGTAIGGLLTAYTGLAKREEAINRQRDDDRRRAGDNVAALAHADILASQEMAHARSEAYGDMLGSARSFFRQGSDGYRALQAVEAGYRAFQLASSIQAMLLTSTETAHEVAHSAIKATAHGAAGAAKIFSQLGVYGFPVVAAMIGVLASLGASGGGSSASPNIAEQRQATQGTGSVLGDSQAKSDSIARSLEIVAKNSNRDLEYSNAMLDALRAIESGIGAVANVLARQLSMSTGVFSTGDLGLGEIKTKGLMGILGKKVIADLTDQGINIGPQSIGQILANGLYGQVYQDVLTVTKKKFLGIQYSNSSSRSTISSPLDGDMTAQIGLLIGSLKGGVVEAARALGVEGAEAMLDSLVVNIGRVSFFGMTGDQIQDELNAIFGKVADDLSYAVLPMLGQFQQVGEGVFETLTRIARDYQIIDFTLASIGKSFGAVGIGSVVARERLIDLSGGLDQFTDRAAYFSQNFLTEMERLTPVQQAVTAEMSRLGLAGVTTKDAFKAVVMGLDLTTEQGAATYAALMAVAPAFSTVVDATGRLDASLQGVAATAEQLARIETQRRELDIRLMDLQGNAAGALAARRSDEIAGADASLRALIGSIHAQEDLNAAREAEAAIAGRRRQLEIQYLDATGDAAGALAARRQDELAALDASLRPLQQLINAQQDYNAMADARTRALEEAAAKEAALLDQRRGLERRLLEAQGDSLAVLAATRAEETAQADASLRSILAAIYAQEDLNAARDAQTQRDEAAAALLSQQADLNIRLMDAMGDVNGALAARRVIELAGADDSLRATLRAIYAAEDLASANAALAEAQAAAAERVTSARNTLTEAYDREAGALNETIKRFQGYGDALRSVRDELSVNSALGTAEAYRRARGEFTRVSDLAAFTDEAALGALPGVIKTFVEASKNNANSREDYLRDVAAAQRSISLAESASLAGVDVATQQLGALNASVSGLIEINKSVISVHDAILALRLAQDGAPIVPAAPDAPPAPAAVAPFTAHTETLQLEVAALRADLMAALLPVAQNTRKTADALNRLEGQGVPVRALDPDAPIEVTVV